MSTLFCLWFSGTDEIMARSVCEQWKEAVKQMIVFYNLIICWWDRKIQNNMRDDDRTTDFAAVLGGQHKWSDREDPVEGRRAADCTTHDFGIISTLFMFRKLEGLKLRKATLFDLPLLLKLNIHNCGHWDFDMLGYFRCSKNWIVATRVAWLSINNLTSSELF